MAEAAKPPDFWSWLGAAISLVLGLWLLIAGWRTLPLARGDLLVADHVGPISYSTPLMRVSSGRGSSTYRTQDLWLVAIGNNQQVYFQRLYRPARGLWVDGIDRLDPGQQVRFLVDPNHQLVYEATSRGKTFLTYDDTAETLTSGARRSFLFGFALLGSVAWHLWPLALRWWRERRGAGASTS
ncbi:hypothetical protein [Bosea sp. (in: a-proteobacteria)]|uniref:hypothetical protein n=1 Tax=Bosea sp. (in: a-proteobacteria) TaxID=1871050 RepID=UPI0025BC8B97|nr:hypothetical protein [Bosea sp. (in: a-proteobacteria)]MBR3190595.1 hypothetical protein [Bosea sp. (in: a-proteobacteria)]